MWLKGLCKLDTDLIPVFQLKVEEVQRRSNRPSALKIKFKELVMKIIRANRISDEDSLSSEQMIPMFEVQKEQELGPPEVRDVRRRTTCRGLENNFNKIEEMKNRQDETKCYSRLLEFDPEIARENFHEAFPRRTDDYIESLVEKEKETERAYSLHLENNRGLRDRIFVGVLLIINCVFFGANLMMLDCSGSEIAMRAIGVVAVLVLFWLTRHFHSNSVVSWAVLAIFSYLVVVENIDRMSGKS